MKAARTITILALTTFACGQQTTNTNCSVNGNNANCTSTTTDSAAQQRQATEAGRQVGTGVGNVIAIMVSNHTRNKWVKNYCASHPGGSWKWTNNADGHVMATGQCEVKRPPH